MDIRLEKCASCHLGVDLELERAGHPRDKLFLQGVRHGTKHWLEKDPWYEIRLWSIRQLLLLRKDAQRALEHVSRDEFWPTQSRSIQSRIHLILASQSLWPRRVGKNFTKLRPLLSGGGSLSDRKRRELQKACELLFRNIDKAISDAAAISWTDSSALDALRDFKGQREHLEGVDQSGAFELIGAANALLTGVLQRPYNLLADPDFLVPEIRRRERVGPMIKMLTELTSKTNIRRLVTQFKADTKSER